LVGVEVTAVKCAAYRQVAAEYLVPVLTAASKHGILTTLSVDARPALSLTHSELVNISVWLFVAIVY